MKKFLAILLGVMIGVNLYAVDFYWKGTYSDEWSLAGNWVDVNGNDMTVLPSSDDNVIFNDQSFLSGHYQINCNEQDGIMKSLTFAPSAADVSNGAKLRGSKKLRVSGDFIMGPGADYSVVTILEGASEVLAGGALVPKMINVDASAVVAHQVLIDHPEGSWELAGSTKMHMLNVITGKFSTANHNLELDYFYGNANQPKEIDLGSSEVNLIKGHSSSVWSLNLHASTVLNAGGSTINFNNGGNNIYTRSGMQVNGLALGVVNFNNEIFEAHIASDFSATDVTFMHGAHIEGDIQCINLTINGGEVRVDAERTVTATNFQAIGSCSNRITVRSNWAGTPFDLVVAANMILTDVDFYEVNLTADQGLMVTDNYSSHGGSGAWLASNHLAKDFVWLGADATPGTGDWNDPTNWGRDFGSGVVRQESPELCIPSSVDNVFMSAASDGGVITLDKLVQSCNDIDFTNISNIHVKSKATHTRLDLFGNATFVQGVTLDQGPNTRFNIDVKGVADTPSEMRFAEVVCPLDLTFSRSGETKLIGGVTVKGDFNLIGGNLSIDNTGRTAATSLESVFCNQFVVKGESVKTLSMNASRVVVAYRLKFHSEWYSADNFLTFDAGTSLFEFTGSNSTITYGLYNRGYTFYDVTGSNVDGSLAFNGLNTFHTVTLHANAILHYENTMANLHLFGSEYKLYSKTNITNGFYSQGEECSYINVISGSAGTQKEIAVSPSAVVDLNYTSFSDINFSDAAVDCSTCFDEGNNSNLDNAIVEFASRDMYWVRSQSDNWSDAGNWRIGDVNGALAGCMPRSADNVFFVENSFVNGNVVNVDIENAYCHDMTWAEPATDLPVFSGTSNKKLNISGSVILSPTMDQQFYGEVLITGELLGTFNASGQTFYNTVSVHMTQNMVWRLDGDFRLSRHASGGADPRFLLLDGMIDMNQFDVYTYKFQATGSSTSQMILDMTGQTIHISAHSASYQYYDAGVVISKYLDLTSAGTFVFEGADPDEPHEYAFYAQEQQNINKVEFTQPGRGKILGTGSKYQEVKFAHDGVFHHPASASVSNPIGEVAHLILETGKRLELLVDYRLSIINPDGGGQGVLDINGTPSNLNEIRSIGVLDGENHPGIMNETGAPLCMSYVDISDVRYLDGQGGPGAPGMMKIGKESITRGGVSSDWNFDDCEGVSQSACSGEPVTMDWGIENGDDFIWTIADVEYNAKNPVVTFVNNGASDEEQEVTLTVVGGNNDPKQIIRTVIVHPEIANLSIGGDGVICSGENHDFTVTSAAANLTGYQWFDNAGELDGEASATLSASDEGAYSVVVTDENGCTATVSAELTYGALSVNTLPTTASSCTGSVMLDSGSPSTNWSDENGPIGGSSTQFIEVFSSGIYSATTHDGCANTQHVDVTYTAYPVLNNLTDVVECENTEVTLDSGDPGSSWTNLTTHADLGVSQTISPTISGTYQALLSDASGNCTTTVEAVVDFKAASTIDVIQTTAGQGVDLQATITSGENIDEVKWSLGTTDLGNNNPVHVTQSGVYTVVVVNEFGCETTQDVEVTIVNDCDYELVQEGEADCKSDEIVVRLRPSGATIPNNMIGMDFTVEVPAGITGIADVTLGNVVTANGDADVTFYFDQTNNLLHVSIYYSEQEVFGTGGVQSDFQNSGFIASSHIAEMTFTTGGLNADETLEFAIRETPGVIENFEDYETYSCATPLEMTVEGATAFKVKLEFWETEVPITDRQVRAFNDLGNVFVQTVDNQGEFVYDPSWGSSVIFGGNGSVSVNNFTDVVQTSQDLYYMQLMTTYRFMDDLDENPYMFIAADYNRNGFVRANDLTLLQRDILRTGNASILYRWLYAHIATFATKESYSMNSDYPDVYGASSPDNGYWKDNVPVRDDFAWFHHGEANLCSDRPEVFAGILLGDVDGSWIYDDGNMKMAPQQDVMIALEQAVEVSEGRYSIPVWVNTYAADFNSIDLRLNMDETNITSVTVENAEMGDYTNLDATTDDGAIDGDRIFRLSGYSKGMLINGNNHLFNLVVESATRPTAEDLPSFEADLINGKETKVYYNAVTAGIEDIASVDFALFPNPAQNQLTLQASDYGTTEINVVIRSASGQLVKQFNNINYVNAFTMDIHGLDAGAYFVEVLNEGVKLTTKKFMKL